MRFYDEFEGIIWEHNSMGDYLKAIAGRIIGRIIGIALIIGLLYLIGTCS